MIATTDTARPEGSISVSFSPYYWKGVSVSTIKTYATMAMITLENSTLSTSFLAAISLPVWNKVMKPK
jgi:hypothetical protein